MQFLLSIFIIACNVGTLFSQAPRFERFTPPASDVVYNNARTVPAVGSTNVATTIKSTNVATSAKYATSNTATSVTLGDDPAPDIDASVRQRIEEDSKRVGRIAENLVGVQGDINRVEKEVLGKVFDMSSMKAFMDKHEVSIRNHERSEKEEFDLTGQASSLGKQLDNAIKETQTQDRKHRMAMTRLSSKVAEDKTVISGLQKELVPLVEMEKEVQSFPEVNANLTAHNTRATNAAQVASQELVYEKSKLVSYQETTSNLMKELVKQHDYATKCHSRLYQLNTQVHDVQTKEAKMKYELSQADDQSEAMVKFLEDKNALIEARLQKAKTNLQTINFAKQNVEAKVASLQVNGESKLEKMKEELGKLREQSANIEAAMMAKVTNRKLIEKALKGNALKIDDLTERLVAGRLLKLQQNNTQMTNDLTEIRKGLQQAQINTAQSDAEKQHMFYQIEHLKNETESTSLKAQNMARLYMSKIVVVKQEGEEAERKASEATLQAEAGQLTSCDSIWEKDHEKVLKQLKVCDSVKGDLDSTRASVASLTATVKSAQR